MGVVAVDARSQPYVVAGVTFASLDLGLWEYGCSLYNHPWMRPAGVVVDAAEGRFVVVMMVRLMMAVKTVIWWVVHYIPVLEHSVPILVCNNPISERNIPISLVPYQYLNDHVPEHALE